MIRKISLLGIFIGGFMAFMASNMYPESAIRPTSAGAEEDIPALPSVTAKAWGIFNPETGEIQVGDNTQAQYPIASVTKLFTANAVMESDRRNEEFAITASDVRTEGQSGKVVSGTKTTMYDLLFPLLIESSNDAGAAISRHMGVSFLESIQNTTDSLLLTKTHIIEPTGLSAKNVSTVQDLAVFYAYVKKHEPHILDITELYTYIDTRTGYGNSNPARKLSSFTGGKQGYTDEAGRTFVGTFILPLTGEEIGVVLLKSSNLLKDIEDILVYAESMRTTSDILVP